MTRPTRCFVLSLSLSLSLSVALLPSTALAGGSCTEDNYVPVSEGNSAEREVSKAAAHIEYTSLFGVEGVVGCSGILVSKNLLLTAGHCVSPPRIGHDTLAEVCADLQVRFDYTKDDPDDSYTSGPAKTYTCDAIVHFAYDGEGGDGEYNEDHALIRLDDDPGLDRGWVDVRLTTDDDIVAGMFHHPDGLPKQMSVGMLVGDFNPFLEHDLDTCVGSSGAALLDEHGNVLGVHVQDDLAMSLGYYWTSSDLKAWGITEASGRGTGRLFHEDDRLTSKSSR